MPLLLHRPLTPVGEIGIWKITEAESFFLEGLELSQAESQQLSLIKGNRRLEWLAARKLVHLMSGRIKRMAFLKDQFGKPYLPDSNYEISISHSHGLAAAIAAPVSVGIDIQRIVPKIERIAHKYMRPVEMKSILESSRIEHLHIYWGAKEALYKAYGRKKLDFCQHILVTPFDFNPDGGSFAGQVAKDEYHVHFDLKYEFIRGFVLVYAWEK